jgi:capsule polysaccharide export protein KpsE/RkpR
VTASRQSAVPAIEQPEILEPSRPGMAPRGGPIESGDRVFIAIRLLWEHRRFVASVLLKGTALFLLTALLIPNSYESTTALMPPDSQANSAMTMLAALTSGNLGTGGGGGGGGGALSMAADLLGLKTTGAVFASVLRSDTVSDRLINRFDLRRVYWVKTYRSARKELESRTTISEDRKSGVINVTVWDRNPDRAAQLTRAYVEELNRLVAELNTSAAHRERVFLEQRLTAVKQELDQSSKDFSEFASRNTTIDIKEQGKAMVESAAVLQGQTIAAESELRGLEQIYTENNVRVRSVQARVAELKRQLDKLGGTPSLDSDPNNPSLYPSIRQLPVLGVPYADLYRRLKINEVVFETLTKMYELAKVEEAKEIPSVKVLDVAEPPEKRSGPPRLLIVVAGAFLSLCFAAMWLFGRETWNATDDTDSRKLLLQEIASVTRAKLTWREARKASARAMRVSFPRRFNGGPPPKE